MVFVTAANARYLGSLINLVGSIHYWSPESMIVIYDLGLEKRSWIEMKKWKNTKVVSGLLDRALPEHCREIMMYAWKPLVMYDAIQRYESILWIDAGSDVRAPVQAIQLLLEEDGCFFVQGQDLDMTIHSHHGTYEKLGTDKKYFKGRHHFAGNLQGYLRDSSAHEAILEPLYRCALKKEYIAPKGSSIANHRYDQTLLSILIYLSDLEIIPHTHMIASSRRDVKEDPMLPSEAIIYTARCASRDYVCQVRDGSGKLLYRV